MGFGRAGAQNGNWRGGRIRGGEQRRYWLRHVPEHPKANTYGYVLEHRLVIEEHLGRYLTDDEVVHHRNHDPSDNRLENLEVLSRSVHARQHLLESGHLLGYRRPPAVRELRICQQCGGAFEATGKKQQRRRFCTRVCYWAYRSGRGRLRRGVAA